MFLPIKYASVADHGSRLSRCQVGDYSIILRHWHQFCPPNRHLVGIYFTTLKHANLGSPIHITFQWSLAQQSDGNPTLTEPDILVVLVFTPYECCSRQDGPVSALYLLNLSV
jgi:hypothetical protein